MAKSEISTVAKMGGTRAAILLMVASGWLFLPIRGEMRCDEAKEVSYQEGLGMTVVCNGRNASISWTNVQTDNVQKFFLQYLCSNQTQPTVNSYLSVHVNSPEQVTNLPLTDPGTVCVFTTCYKLYAAINVFRSPADQANCSAVLPSSTLESGSVYKTVSSKLSTSEHSSNPSETVLPPSNSHVLLTTSSINQQGSGNEFSTIATTASSVTAFVVITLISIVSLLLSIYAVKRRAKRNTNTESDIEVQFVPEEALKGLEILYREGSELTLLDALQMEGYEKEQIQFASSTLDKELTDSTAPSLSDMSSSCLQEDVKETDKLSSSIRSSISLTDPGSTESKSEVNVTKTEEKVTQPCSPTKPVGLEDPGYLDFPSKTFSDVGAIPSSSRYIITGVSLTDDYDDLSLCTEL